VHFAGRNKGVEKQVLEVAEIKGINRVGPQQIEITVYRC